MPAPVLFLAHAPNAQAIADRIKDELSELGFTVENGAGPATRRGQAARIEAAHKVVLLWSRAARGTPALRAAARRARAKGTLVCVSLDTAPPPAGALATQLPRSVAAWRRVLASKSGRVKEITPPRMQSRPARARRDPALRITKQFPMTPLPKPLRKSGLPLLAPLLALALLAAAAGTVAYAQDATFAERVNTLASQARTMATSVVADLGS